MTHVEVCLPQFCLLRPCDRDGRRVREHPVVVGAYPTLGVAVRFHLDGPGPVAALDLSLRLLYVALVDGGGVVPDAGVARPDVLAER